MQLTATLNLREDKRVAYEQRFGSTGIVSKGIWKQVADTLRLTDTLKDNVLVVRNKYILLVTGSWRKYLSTTKRLIP
jgi:hypothetical protein